jgi:hypothetical protein
MRRVHRLVVSRLADAVRPEPVKAVLVDTPYGFQENAPALSAAGLEFLSRLGAQPSLASVRRDSAVAERETSLARIRDADLVFSGPGSPSYALAQWSGTAVADAFVEKLIQGGALVCASAAALCLGRVTLPVYEIYKAGADPYWLPGLDVLAAIGLNLAVIPHWDNREGAGFDTRFCWLGERRLAVLEGQLPEGTHILGIDEHTALVIDLEEGRASAHGRGGVTVRHHGASRVIAAGDEVALVALKPSDSQPAPARPESGEILGGPQSPTLLAKDAAAHLASRVLELEQRVAGATERAQLVGPLVEAMLEVRGEARAQGDFATADAIRNRLLELGIEVADSAGGLSTWRINRQSSSR